MIRSLRYVVHFPARDGLLDHREFRGSTGFQAAIRFATDCQVRLRRTQGPAAAGRVTIDTEAES